MNSIADSSLETVKNSSSIHADKTSMLANADSYFANQDFASAWQELNQINQIFGGAYEIYAAMALCSMSLNDLDRARIEYFTSIRYAPDNAEIRLNLAVVEKSLGLLDDAYHQIQIVLGLNSDDLLARRIAADISVLKGNFDLAVLDYRRVLDHSPDDIDSLLGYGRCLFSLGRLNESLDIYHKILSIDPSHEIAQDNIVILQKRMGNETKKPFTGDRKLLFQEARDMMNQGNHSGAKDLLRPLLFSSDATADTCFIYGNLCLLEGNYEEALVNYTKMVEFDPSDIRGHIKLGSTAVSIGMKDLARKHIDTAQSIDPTHPDIQEIEIDILMLEKNYLPAAQRIYKIISKDMSNADLLTKMGQCFENLGDYQLASDTYKKALEINPAHQLASENLKCIKHFVNEETESDVYKESNAFTPLEEVSASASVA